MDSSGPESFLHSIDISVKQFLQATWHSAQRALTEQTELKHKTRKKLMYSSKILNIFKPRGNW